MSVELLLVSVLYGLTLASTLILIASGLSLIFGIVGVVNFAHGSFCMLGAYVGYSVVAATGSFWLALLAAPVAVVVVALVIERLGLRPLYRLGHLYQLFLTFALSLVVSNLVLWIWGGDNLSIPKPAYLSGFVMIADITYPKFRLFVLLWSGALALALWFVVARTTWGAVLRAGLHDIELVEAFGIDTERLVMTVFALAAALAAVAGVVVGAMRNVNPEMDLDLINSALLVVVIGGLGSFRGAVAGSLVLGFADAFGAQMWPGVAKFTPWIVMVAVLLWRPEGLVQDA